MTNSQAVVEMAEITYSLPPPFRKFLNEMMLELAPAELPNEEFLGNVRYATEELKRAIDTYLTIPTAQPISGLVSPPEYLPTTYSSPGSSGSAQPTDQFSPEPYPSQEFPSETPRSD